MGAGARTAEAERIEEFMKEKLGFDIGKLLESYADGDGSLSKAAFHLGKEKVQKVIELLSNEEFMHEADDVHDVQELTWSLKEDLEELMEP